MLKFDSWNQNLNFHVVYLDFQDESASSLLRIKLKSLSRIYPAQSFDTEICV